MSRICPSGSDLPLYKALPKLLALGMPVLLAAALGAVASVDAAGFYASLVQPDWAPPAGVFGPAWSLLYAMMAIAVWRVSLQRASAERRRAFALFFAQLSLNALWSWLFFAWRRGGWAMLDLVVLFVAVSLTARAFWRIDRPAGVLLLPYLAWLVFAGALNWAIWMRNPALLG